MDREIIICCECDSEIDFRKKVYMVNNEYLHNCCHENIKEVLGKELTNGN